MAIPEDPQAAGARESAGIPAHNETSEPPPVASAPAEIPNSEPAQELSGAVTNDWPSSPGHTPPYEYLPVELSPEVKPDIPEPHGGPDGELSGDAVSTGSAGDEPSSSGHPLPVELSPEVNPEYHAEISESKAVDAVSVATPDPERAHEVTGEVVNDWSSSHGDYSVPLTPPASSAGALPPPPPPDPPKDEEEEEEDGMTRMSFLEHLEELRTRLLMTLAGIGVAVIVCMIFKEALWAIVFGPAKAALIALNVTPPTLRQIGPTDTFQIIWMKVPILFACFLSSPWILYQVWAFISPGLYKHERRYAVPFVVSSAGLFILGGVFAYYVAFRFGLEFLLGIGIGQGIDPAISVNEYYDLFVDIMLGVGIVFEIPILLFLLTLVRIVKPGFLVRHSRYVILAIVCLAAVITPTGDVFNLAIFATPMIVLFYVGILASYMLVLKREKRRFPWMKILPFLLAALAVLLGAVWFLANHYGYHFVQRWPLFVK
jgi:sec-independent protein translocase protein TatC